MDDKLTKWIEKNKLQVTPVTDNIVDVLDFGKCILINPKDTKILDVEMNIILTEQEQELIDEDKDLKAAIFSFGGRFYYTTIEREKWDKNNKIRIKFDDFKNIGKYKGDFVVPFVHLGVHTEYELLNGSHKAKDWVKKAKFFGHESIGICDKNALGGTLSFQIACEEAKIEPIFGMTASVLYDISTENETFDLKLYARNKDGWQNLLNINKKINVDNDGFIKENEILKYTKGILLVIPSNSIINNKEKKTARKFVELYLKHFSHVFYQFDTVKYKSVEFETKKLKAQSVYLNEFSDILQPVLLNDSYYLEQEEAEMKTWLNKTGKRNFPATESEYFKDLDDSLELLSGLFNEKRRFKNGDDFGELMERMINNSVKIGELCNFKIDIGHHKLPAFESGKDNQELFLELINKGWKQKIVNKIDDSLLDEYMRRLEMEAGVIIDAGFVDYFLINWDVIRWSKDNGIYVGNARGSVAGSLISFLLDITTVDPIAYGLLFERFLNETRLSGEKAGSYDSKPDIDVDFEGLRRDDVKKYLKDRYGENYVCSIGTYSRMKLKGAIKDSARLDKTLDFSKVNYLTKSIDDRVEAYTWEDFIEFGVKNREIYQFIQKYPEIAINVRYALNQVKTASVHASAVVIVPKFDSSGKSMTIFDWMPVKRIYDEKTKSDILVSEWEGKFVDRAGFLKEDLLGLVLLDKFQAVIKLIKKNHDKKIILEDIPLDDDNVYKLFQRGFNEEIFQFGTVGIKEYSKQVKPDCIEDLTAMNALYRPGPKSSNAHTAYAEIKHGKRKPEFDYMLKDITKDTFGLYVYQEQIMKAVHVLGKLTLTEADDV